MLGRRIVTFALMLAAVSCSLVTSSSSEGKRGPCPPEMAFVKAAGSDATHAFCIDRWEASLVEVRGKKQVPHPPSLPVGAETVKAVSRAGALPQGYISRTQAEAACKNARKRLCTGAEWERACRGPQATTFPYGEQRKSGACNDVGHAPLASLYPGLGDGVYASEAAMNDPRIDQAKGTVAPSGSYAQCKSSYGAFDMVGNLHEWVADVQGGRGTFRGGYFQDTHLNGDGCLYRTVAHAVDYHDYSTGFRCCAEPR